MQGGMQGSIRPAFPPCQVLLLHPKAQFKPVHELVGLRGQAMCCRVAAVARREHVSPKELHAAVCLHGLEALCIAMRSEHNRTILVGLSVFQNLFRIFKVCQLHS